MIENALQISLTEPVLWDYVLKEIQDRLMILPYIDNAYGKAQRLTDTKAGKQVFYPAVPIVSPNSNEYLNLLPDGHLGNFCYFEIEDGRTINNLDRTFIHEVSGQFSIIFWFDLRTVYPTAWQTKTVQNVIYDILEVLTLPFYQSVIRINKVFENVENIYKGYTHNEIRHQFLMRPFGGFRLTGSIKSKSNCK